MSLEFYVTDQSLFSDAGIAIHILEARTDHIVTDLVMKKRDPGSPLPSPPLQVRKKEAQELMSQLWNLGIRPTDELLNSHAPNSLKAVEKHLGDMRAIAFNKLEIVEPK